MPDFGSAYEARQVSRGRREAQNRAAIPEHRAFAADQVESAYKWNPVIGGLTALAYATAAEPIWQNLKTWSKFQANPEAQVDGLYEIPGYALSKIIPRGLGDYIVRNVDSLKYDPEMASDFELIDTMPQTALGAWEGFVRGMKGSPQKFSGGGLARYQLQRTR